MVSSGTKGISKRVMESDEAYLVLEGFCNEISQPKLTGDLKTTSSLSFYVL